MAQTQPPMSFLQLWWIGLWQPSRAFLERSGFAAPLWGLWAILIRFVVTALTTTLALYLLGRTPFTPSYLTFLPTERYYQVLMQCPYSVWWPGSSRAQ